MTPNLETWETGNAAATDKGRRGQREMVWERHDEFHYRQTVVAVTLRGQLSSTLRHVPER